MNESYQLGIDGELEAIKYLKINGYHILETRYHFRKAEIDIIAQKKSSVFFVEVKSRSWEYIPATDSITSKKMKLILLAAGHFLEQLDEAYEAQFDIITVIFQQNKTPKISHIPDAFNAADIF